jgi:hypothetical protein
MWLALLLVKDKNSPPPQGITITDVMEWNVLLIVELCLCKVNQLTTN